MKILKTLCLLAFAAVMPAMLTSCDDDDEPSSSASSSSSAPYFGLRDCGKVISSLDMEYGSSISFVYDGSGRVVEVRGVNETVSYDYNSQTGKAVEEYDSDKIISFDADANGRFNSLTQEDSWDKDKDAYEFRYNSDGNVISVVETFSEVLDGKLTNTFCYTCTFMWDGDLLTSVRCTERGLDDSTDEYEMKITYSDVDNKYRTPLCGLTTLLFEGWLYPNELSIAPAKLPKKIEYYYVQGEVKDELMCKYSVDDDGFIESEYIEGYVSGIISHRGVDIRYTYAYKEF